MKLDPYTNFDRGGSGKFPACKPRNICPFAWTCVGVGPKFDQILHQFPEKTYIGDFRDALLWKSLCFFRAKLRIRQPEIKKSLKLRNA